MCSRYFLDADGNIIAYTFRVAVQGPIRKRFNIAPTQEVLAVVENEVCCEVMRSTLPGVGCSVV